MAKGLRASSKKSNRTKLRARVFEPVENARLERIHQKLLETAHQPKPETAKEKEMDVDSAEGSPPLPPHTIPTPTAHPLTSHSTDAADAASKEESFPKGSFFLSASIPPSLSDTLSEPADEAQSSTFYHLLGLCSDVVGFTPAGALAFAFDPLAPHTVQ